jgi:glycine cleavage system regulatory protein
MNVLLVMTVIGADRPGLVDRLSTVIADQEGNWLESRMANLGGQFAGILRVQVPAARKGALLEQLAALDADGLKVLVHDDRPAAAVSASTGTLARLEVVGHDRPGIIREISQVLAGLDVNVEDLATATESAPMAADLLFRARAKVHLPEGCSLDDLQQALETIASDLMVDLTSA